MSGTDREREFAQKIADRLLAETGRQIISPATFQFIKEQVAAYRKESMEEAERQIGELKAEISKLTRKLDKELYINSGLRQRIESLMAPAQNWCLAKSENASLRGELEKALDRYKQAGVRFCECGHLNMEHYGAADWQTNPDCDYLCSMNDCSCKKFRAESALSPSGVPAETKEACTCGIGEQNHWTMHGVSCRWAEAMSNSAAHSPADGPAETKE